MHVNDTSGISVRPVERDEAATCPERLLSMLRRQVGRTGNLGNGRLAGQLRLKLLLGTRQAATPLMYVNRQPDRVGLVTDGTIDRLANPPHRVGRELRALSPVIALSGAHQADRSLLDQVEQRHATMRVSTGDRDDEAEIRLDHAVLRAYIPCLDSLGKGY